MKQEEIQKGKLAWKQWANDSDHVGRLPKGFQYNRDGDGLEPDDEFETVAEGIRWSESWLSYREIQEDRLLDRDDLKHPEARTRLLRAILRCLDVAVKRLPNKNPQYHA